MVAMVAAAPACSCASTSLAIASAVRSGTSPLITTTVPVRCWRAAATASPVPLGSGWMAIRVPARRCASSRRLGLSTTTMGPAPASLAAAPAQALRCRPPLAAAAALVAPAAPAFAGVPVMPLSQVHSGMRCTGYSVVHGTDISSFDVDVLDVVDGDPAEDGPRILVEVSGPAVDRTGIGPGFSGSPIYCDGRNIGAISESIGEYGGKVVPPTPIEAMLANSPDAPRGPGDSKARS